MGIVVLALLCTTFSPSVNAQTPSVEQKVLQDLKGEDLDGRDGPLAPLGADLTRLYHQHRAHQKTADGTPFQPSSSFLPVQGEMVTVDVLAMPDQGASLKNQLRALGGEHLARRGRLVSGHLPIAALPEAAALASLHSAEPAWRTPSAGRVTTQGDQALNADDARRQSGVDGTGITVGVISDSYDQDEDAATTAQDDIDSGDLPPASRIEILADPQRQTDEGRAMMQLIHDIAPGADLAFHTGFTGQANLAEGIRELADNGSTVIVDDVQYFAEPMFQDGAVSNAIEDVTDDGVAYFSAVGNSARQSHIEADGFVASGDTDPNGNPLHDFDGSGDTHQQVTIPKGVEVPFILQWSDPYASASSSGTGAETDLDFYLEDQSGEIVARSETVNLEGDPTEVLKYTNDGSVDANDDGNADTIFNLVIKYVEGEALDDPSDQMRYVFLNGRVSIDEHKNPGPSSYGHTDAANSHSVAAALYTDTPAFGTDPPTVRSSSSEGGIPILFDDDGNRLSSPETPPVPDVTGPSGGNTTFFREDSPIDSDDDPNFFGTSAAAPHVAGVAALLKSKAIGLSPNELYAALENTAIDMDDPETENFDDGYDRRTGHGFVRADQALQQFEAVTADIARSFGGASSATDYKLVALPGQPNRSIGRVVDGTVGEDWQAYRDDGSGSDFLQRYDGSDTFRFQNGNGFWLISTQDWTTTLGIAPAETTDGTTKIPLREGWNIISNPLDQDVNWADVDAANEEDLSDNPIWAFDGSYSESSTFASATGGAAYYFNNPGLDHLDIPEPSNTTSTASAKADSEPMMTLSAAPEGGNGPASTVRVGMSPNTRTLAAPPGQFEAVSLRIKPSETTPTRSNLLMAEQRPMTNEGETFDLQLTSSVDGPITLTPDHLDALNGRSASLLHPAAGTTHDLRAGQPIRVAPLANDSTTLKLVVGTDDYVDDRTADVLPDDITLTAYPNPMRQHGMLEYGLPKASTVTLRVYDVLGRAVTTLAHGRKQAGVHTVRLDTDPLANGVYFARLQVDGQTRTRKITVVR